ncbi:MAG: putative lipid II flippase FtsW [Pseudomonadales bacterium]|nr:putative lipid II flippase FtsW [Pseudomonadales bacterium]
MAKHKSTSSLKDSELSFSNSLAESLAERLGVQVGYLLILIVAMLVSLGLIMVGSASMEIAANSYDNPFHFLTRHSIYVALGLVISVVVYQCPLVYWQRYSGLLLLASFILLTVVLIPGIGRTVNGSTRWIGIGPLTLQASEIAKLFVVVYMAGYLVRRQDEVREQWSGFLKPMGVLSVMVVLLLLEPDFGAVVVMVSAAMGMIFVSGARVQNFVIMTVCCVLAGLAAIMMAPYRVARALSFLNPWADQYGSGYQLTQSLIAFGRGEWFGVGLGESIQKLFYLPEAHTDFVFAVMAEELGLVADVFVIVAFVALVLCAFSIASRAKSVGEDFSSFLAYGIGLLIGIQAFINLGVNIGILPTKGLTLPLVSYGGSSLLISFVMVAVLLRIDRDNQVACSLDSASKKNNKKRTKKPALSRVSRVSHKKGRVVTDG